MNSSPVFSVVMPVYNKASHILRAISSVMNQSFQGFELILVDDDSLDNSVEIVESFMNELPMSSPVVILIKTERGQNGGPATARNRGVEAARGEWIAFLDADDEWSAGLLEEFRRLMDKFPNQDFLCSAQYRISPEGIKSIDPYSQSLGENRTDKVLSLLDYARLGSVGLNPIQTSAVCVKKTLLLNVGIFPEGCRRGEDRDTWLRILMHSDLTWTPYIGSIYYRDSENMVTNLIPLGLSEVYDATISIILDSNDFSLKYGNKFVHYLKKMSNYDKRRAYKNQIKSSQISVRDLNHFYWEAEPFYFCYLLFWSLLPRPIIKMLFIVKDVFKKGGLSRK